MAAAVATAGVVATEVAADTTNLEPQAGKKGCFGAPSLRMRFIGANRSQATAAARKH